MSAAEFGGWLHLFHKYGWGFDLEDWRMGRVCETVANFSGRLDARHLTKAKDFYKRVPK